MRSQAATAARARCIACGSGLSFAAWSRGEELCPVCDQVEAAPAAMYVPAPRQVRPAVAPVSAPVVHGGNSLPDEMFEDLVAALEAEAARAPQSQVQAALHDVLEEVGFGRDSHEMSWAAWGFAGGFAVNLAMAKYAQMATDASMTEFIPAFVFGGAIAGATCAAIGWALAKLKFGYGPYRWRINRQ
jgi:hypothetical protein